MAENIQRYSRGATNPFTVVTTTDETYSANYGDLVIIEGGVVELPEPQQDEIIGVRNTGQYVKLQSVSGLIQSEENRAVSSGVEETVYLVSDGVNWYTISDQSLVTGAIPDSEGNHEWLLDEGEGTTGVDRVGNADLTLSITQWLDEGVGGHAIDLNGTSDHATASQADLTESGDSGAIMVIYLVKDDFSDRAAFWDVDDDDRNYLYGAGDDLDVGLAETATDTGHGLGTGDLNINEWNGVCLSWDTGDYDLFLYDYPNETFKSGSGTYSGSVSINGDFDIGRRGDGDNDRHLEAGVDFPRWFDGPLSSSDAQAKFEELSSFYA